jgi:hypothetical protein
MPQNSTRTASRRRRLEPSPAFGPNRAKIGPHSLLLKIPRNYAGAAGLHLQPFFFSCLSAQNDARFLIANLELEIAVTYSKQRIAVSSNRN